MKKIVRPLLVLHENPVFRDRLRRAARNDFQFHWVTSWEGLREMVRSAPPAALVVVDPYRESPHPNQVSPALGNLLREFPSLTVLAAFEVGPGCFEQVRRLGEWGVAQVICLDEEHTVISLEQRLRSASGRPLRSLVERSLPPYTSGYARAILGAAVQVVSAGGHTRDLARALDITERTLTRWCQRAGLPVPRRLLAWMRILLAAELLDDPGRRVVDLAYACGYSADASLRLALKTFLGRTPTELRQEGAFAVASREFLAALAEARAKQRVSGEPAGRL